MDLRSPATVGHGILLPLEAIDWDDAALHATLAHEAQHIREGDFYLQLAATLHHCFFWISPHAWWLRPQLSRLSEAICDRAAIASSGDGLSYAQLLLRFATAEQTPAGMLAMAQSAGLRERIDRLIADPQLTSTFRHRRGQGIVAAALLATAAVVAAASVHILQPETIVLAAPQAPAPPSAPSCVDAPQAAPSPAAAPDAAPAPALVPAPPALAPPAPEMAPPPPDTVNPPEAIIKVVPDVHVKTEVASDIRTKVLVLSKLNNVSAIGPLTMVHPIVTADVRTHVLALPQVEVVSPEGPIDLHGRGYAIYGPDGDHMVMMHGWISDSDKLHDEQAKHPGGAILFERDGKTYVIDDPALVKQDRKSVV